MDARTRIPGDLAIKGIQLVPQAKYLGIVIDDDLSFKTESKMVKKQI